MRELLEEQKQILISLRQECRKRNQAADIGDEKYFMSSLSSWRGSDHTLEGRVYSLASIIQHDPITVLTPAVTLSANGRFLQAHYMFAAPTFREATRLSRDLFFRIHKQWKPGRGNGFCRIGDIASPGAW